MNKQSSVQRMFEIWHNAINNGTISVTITKKGTLWEIHKEVEEQFTACKKLHEQEVKNAFLQGFIEGSYRNSDLYNPTKVKWHNSKHYYNETFGDDTP